MNDPMSYQGDSVTLPPYGITHKIHNRPYWSVGVGDQFTQIELDGVITVLEIRGNDLLVELNTKSGGIWRETWNLEHTIVGFKQGNYRKKSP